jgi:O-acetyl-ADP-ribose deacetylase (regulator of RNase III)
VPPICIFPWNFIECASNQLVNHLTAGALPDGGYHPRVIIRTAIPSYQPFDPGPQHDDDFTDLYRAASHGEDRRLEKAEDSVGIPSGGGGTVSVILAEYTERYKDVRAGGD